MKFAQGHSGTKVRDVNRACFPKETHQNSEKWAKFMNFSFCPFLWFGLPGRLLSIADYRCYTPTSFRKNGLSQSKVSPWRVVSQGEARL